MDFWDVIAKRHSVRHYDSAREVSDSDVQRLLTAAIQAPSAGNRQPWHFIVVRDRTIRQGLVNAAYGQEFLLSASVVIAVCTVAERSSERYGQRGKDLYCIQDTAAAVEHILLGATALGMGTCWVGAFDEAAAFRVLDLPKELRPVALIPIGYPAKTLLRQTTRIPLEEVVTFK